MRAAEPSTRPQEGDAHGGAPSIALPKGGGAIRGIGEKFAANPVTGTGSMTVPIATSPGRSGFGPQLSLSYDSGAGNGPFGFGWSLSLPAITRKTDKGLPQYRDAEESDVYLLSGAEDLVSVLRPDGTRFEDDTTVPGYVIHRYRPRIEGLFARIERWTHVATGDIHWRSITRDNVTTLYGKDNNSRIVDPADPDPQHPARIFSWLICASYDDKGNAIVYEYEAENDANVDLSQANERHRLRTANRYPKRIRYGNRTANRHTATWQAIDPTGLPDHTWMFEVVFDYDEGHYEAVDLDPARPEAEQHRFVRASASAAHPWAVRPDPFSSYRAGFEVRTYRRCRRVLMFHHIPDLPTGEKGYDGLVRSTEFDYADLDYRQPVAVEDELVHQGSTRFASFIRRITQSGYVRDDTQAVIVRDGVEYATYLKKSLPPLEFEYSKAAIQEQVGEIDPESLENLPVGLDGASYQWVDLHGEGIPGILAEQAGAWFYKRNLSPLPVRENGSASVKVRLAPVELVAAKPHLALADGRAQFMDLAGDGQPDLVVLDGPTPGLYEHDDEEGWQPFRPFTAPLNRDGRDPNLRFVDLDGDGHADVLITEDDAFVWHPSLAEQGFGPAQRVAQALDEEKGPRLVFADGTQSIYLADMSGDGLTDLVRLRNGEVCYWPNLGYGRFGPKVTMDNAPWFDAPDQFDQRRLRLADIDGSGTTDVICLARDGVRLYFNQSGNRLSEARRLAQFPPIDTVSSVMTADLLGNGTACLVWSSPLPGMARRPMRYVDLMGGQKPHLLVRAVNNLGAETRIQYAPSTMFYLADERAGQPWITRLPFPVHVVERVETYDRISRNRFVTRYAYHHGYFDGVEREFRGFGMVEQWDTEGFSSLAPGGGEGWGEGATNWDEASHMPPVYTKTWFHTGVYLGRERVSRHSERQYYREPGLTDAQARALLLDDTVLPDGLTADEEREACRALKGSMLRQEVYALDGTDKEKHPYTVAEQNFTVRLLQSRGSNRHAVVFAHARESLSYHYERIPADPRLGHALTLEVDDFGNVLQSAAIGYGRRQPDMTLSPADRAKQTQILITYTENRVTNAVESADEHRAPLPCESRTYELTGLTLPAGRNRFTFEEILDAGRTAIALDYEQTPTPGRLEKRLLEHVRTYYRRNNLAGPLPLGELQSLALPFESYTLALTPGLVAEVYGGRVSDAMLADEGRYVHTEGDANWWIPSGRLFYSPDPADTPPQELAYARQHFFLPHRYRDPFHTAAASTESFVTYDAHDLLVQETRDALGNRVTVGERNVDPTQPPARLRQDYRVLQPAMVMDPNRNRSEVAFDALGLVVGTAVMGKPAPAAIEGDSLAGFRADLTQAEIERFLADPKGPMAAALLGDATTRIVYDLTAYWREPDPNRKPPAVAATLARETHVSDLQGQQSKIQVSLSYSDGFGREIQKKIQAEPGPVPQRDANGKIIVGTDGQPQMTANEVSPRWVGSGWTVFNNKGKPVRQYEPFFTDTHRFEFEPKIGVSPVLFYDPVERVVATLHPNHTWEKVVFDPWRQETWDVNDTLLLDPQLDPLLKGFVLKRDGTPRLPTTEYQPSWYALRTDPTHAAAFAARYPDPKDRANETSAARKAEVHAATPAVAHFDTLGRTFRTVVHNKFKYSNTPPADPPVEEFHVTRVILDIEGNQREVIDARGRVVMRYDYDMLGNRIHQASMEAGERWMLNDAAGKALYAWDSRDHRFRTAYDPLRRPTDAFLREGVGAELLVGKTVYGERRPNPEAHNLRGKAVEVRDQAGVVTSDEYDFKGNLLRSQRQLAQAYQTTLDWSGAVSLEADTYTSRTRYDALNRPIQSIAPHSDRPGTTVNVIQPVYNEANLLEQVHAWLNRNAEPGGLLDPATASLHAVTDIDYNAKGQRERIDYGNGAVTTYKYDLLTFRLVQLKTLRGGEALQDLHYAYDPAGNITHIRDEAQQTIYFKNKRVEPSAEYTYDALYRLIEATGREHLGQAGGAPMPHSYNDAPRVGILHPGDGNAMGTYLERYLYDAVGNFLELQHRGADPVHPGWTRTYAYNEASLLEPGKQSNRLSRTQVGNNNPITESYAYDAHGNMTAMPQLQVMQWDFRDQLQMTRRQAVNNNDTDGLQHQGERTYYVYDSGGQRVRKVTELSTGQVKDERIYLGGFEIYRKNGVNPLVRETLHLMDDQQRIALVETRTQGNDGSPPQLIRYQFGNHLGSASLELDNAGQIISYEEYYPYGSTVYQAVRSQTETPKRYRYTGKERDEESGLYYHGARYYAPWVGRWTSCDPKGLVDGSNVFAYARDNPLMYADPTGTQCDPTMQSCVDPTAPTPREEALQQSLPEHERYLPPPAALPSSSSSSLSGGSMSLAATFMRHATPPAPVSAAPVQAANSIDDLLTFLHAQAGFETGAVRPPTFNPRSASAFGTAAHARATTVLDEMQRIGFLGSERIYSEVRVVNGVVTQVGGTPGGPAGAHNIDIMVARPGQTISVGNNISGGVADLIGDLKYGGGVIDPKYAVHGSPLATITGRTTAVPEVPAIPEPMMTPSARWFGAGVGALNVGGGALMLASVNPERDPALVTARKITSGGASLVGGGLEVTGALLRSAALLEGGAALSGVGLVVAAPIMAYEMRPRGWIASDPALVERARREGRNPFCAQCHGPGGALDPNNDWNAGGARRAAFVRRLQWVYLGD
jgi:RHS repeat-associated protein